MACKAPTHTRSNSFYLSTLSTPPSPRKMTETTTIHHKECFVSLKFFKNHAIFLGKISQLTLIWQQQKASMEESKYLRRLGPSTTQFLMPTGSCCLAGVVGFFRSTKWRIHRKHMCIYIYLDIYIYYIYIYVFVFAQKNVIMTFILTCITYIILLHMCKLSLSMGHFFCIIYSLQKDMPSSIIPGILCKKNGIIPKQWPTM